MIPTFFAPLPRSNRHDCSTAPANRLTIAPVTDTQSAKARALWALLPFAGLLGSPTAQAADEGALAACAALADGEARLACYDKAVGRNPELPAGPKSNGPLVTVPPDKPVVVAAEPNNNNRTVLTLDPEQPPETDHKAGLFEDRWSLGRAGADSRFDVRAHKPTYVLPLRYTDSPNRSPRSPTQPAPGTNVDLQNIEAKFQISFKVRLLDFGEVLGNETRLAVWGAYTQQSQWQIYNRVGSRPFRETNYEPEVIVALDPNVSLGNWHWRLAAISLTHQSNGREDPLSRSWDRVIAQLGVEHNGLGIQLRAWRRLNESITDDDNPDIGRFMGYGDLLVTYQLGQHTFSVLGRRNVSAAKGAVQAGWSFPIGRRLRGTVQYFEGYGESLIDYNFKQRTLGVGLLLADWL